MYRLQDLARGGKQAIGEDHSWCGIYGIGTPQHGSDKFGGSCTGIKGLDFLKDFLLEGGYHY